jgi:hypothetical protein
MPQQRLPIAPRASCVRLGLPLTWVRLVPQSGGADWGEGKGRTEWDPHGLGVDREIIRIEAGHIAGAIFDPASEAAAYDGRDKQMIEERRSSATQSPDALRHKRGSLSEKIGN